MTPPKAARCLLAGAALCAAACGSDEVTQQNPLCATETRATADEGAQHVSSGSTVSYGTNPPASGSHYPIWGRWGQHSQPLPRGNYVHNLEHGGVVLLYRCDAGCPDTVAALRGLIDSWPQDPACQAPVRSRLILTPDPLLDVPVAAAAWQNIYRADCVDLPSLRAFITAHYDRAPESLCADGAVP